MAAAAMFDRSMHSLVEMLRLLEQICDAEISKWPQFKMAAASILYVDKLLLFLYYLTNHRQIVRISCNFSLEHILNVENGKWLNFIMTAWFLKLLQFLYYFTNHH